MPAKCTMHEYIYVAFLLDRERTMADKHCLKPWNQFFLGPPMDGNACFYLETFIVFQVYFLTWEWNLIT